MNMIIIRFIIILITAALVVTVAMAQEASATESASSRPKDDDSYQVDAAQNPLKPADTSSPSDTLRSFLTDMTIVIDEWQERGALLSLAGYQAYNRASSTLDFSTTPDSDSRTIINLRLAMLQEILARIELPPDGEIPGDDDLAQSTLNQWTIPGSRITIQRIEKGPRAGEFLFSAWTVQRFHRYYRQIKHLPYKPDTTPGVYEASLRSNSSVAYLERPVRNRLKPVDTSSPRSALKGFPDSVNRAYVLLMEADAALKANPPTITRDEARKIETIAQNLMKRAESTLDLSKVPGAIRDDVGIESVLRLKEIFDRMHLPPIESVPDMEMVKDERQRLSSTALGNTRPVRWRYPNTTIEIVEIMDGEQQGNFLFSANTVRRLDQFYNKVRDLPYRGDYSQIALEYVSPETSQGFYEYYISTPGDLIPLDSFWGRLVEGLPGWFKTMYHGQTVWQWISLVVVLALAVLFLVAFHGILLRRPAQLSVVNRNWRRVFFNLFTIGAVYILFWFLDDTVNLTGSELMVVRTCLTLAVWYFLATGTLYLSNAIAETIIASPKIDPEGIQASYLRALFGIFGLATMAVLMVWPSPWPRARRWKMSSAVL